MKHRHELYDGDGNLVQVTEKDIPPQEELEIITNNRRNEFKKIDGEGMDAMRGAIEYLANFLVADLPSEYRTYAEKIEAIKTKYKKEN